MKILVLLCGIVLFSCASNTGVEGVIQNPSLEPESIIEPNSLTFSNFPRQESLHFTFAGDIMAHNVNYNMKNYDIIYDDVREILYNDDLSFANLEVPVCDDLPYETYPTFNIQSPYAMAAVNGGFDAFSLSNNHTNDQGLKGIKSTLKFFESIRNLRVWNTGIKRDNSISYEVINTQGWTVLFASITEILNAYNNTSTFDFYSFTEKGRLALKNDIIKLQKEHPHDIFVLGVHVADPEYDTTITDSRRKWFYELLDCGVDIIWGNHPHVTKEWEHIHSENGDKLIMYSIGNTISGQNYWPAYDTPLHEYEDTGTSVLLQVAITDKNHKLGEFTDSNIGDAILKFSLSHTYIATHKDEHNNMLIKQLTPEFIDQQNKQNRAYYKVRLEDMKNFQGITIDAK